jgi:prophage regulatory protein
MSNNAPEYTSMSQAIYRLPAVKARTGLSRSTIYLRMADGTFPKQISIGERAVGWLDSEIAEWLNERIKQSRKQVGASDA